MKDHNQNPAELIRQAQEGDTEAFARVYDQYFVPVYRYIYFRVKSKAEAEDLTQTVFLKVFAALDRFEERDTSPLAYFFTVARNAVISYWRKKKDVLPDDPDTFFETAGGAIHDPHIELERSEAGTEIKQSIKKLTDEQQEVIVMKFIGELSNKEISEILGKREDAIRQIQSRGLKALREHLTSEQS